ncbi:HNH endonuclease signature motif containing protein [Microbacterium paludicola]|uniref:HNH endonuclease signature motif containing protein n=1 Tax=Microbacterium paludicola TaxID=300019 RepID=UPI0031DDB5B8
MAATPWFEDPSRDPREAVAAAAGALEGVFSQVGSLADADVVAFTRQVEALGRLVDGLRVRAAGEVDARSDLRAEERLSALHGCRNGIELLERLTLVSSATVRARIVLDKRTRPRFALTGEELPAEHPAIGAALEDGTLGLETAGLIGKMLARVAHRADPVRLADAEAWLVGQATDPTQPRTFDEVVVQVLAQGVGLDQDGLEPSAEEAAKRRGFTIGALRNGLHPVRGDVTPEAAGTLQMLFDAHSNPAVRFGTHPADTEAGEPWGPDETVPDDRTPTQKRHDILHSAIQTAARAEDTPSLGGAAPTLLVHVAAEDLLSPTGVASIDGIQTPMPASLAHRIACTGAVQKIVFDNAGRIVRLGTKERLFNTHQRKAIAARDGGCVIPGCSIRASWCEIHHVTDHAKGGPTHTDNGVMLCWWHHHNLERSGWGIRINRGIVETKAPPWIDPRGHYRPAPNAITRRRSRPPVRAG